MTGKDTSSWKQSDYNLLYSYVSQFPFFQDIDIKIHMVYTENQSQFN